MGKLDPTIYFVKIINSVNFQRTTMWVYVCREFSKWWHILRISCEYTVRWNNTNFKYNENDKHGEKPAAAKAAVVTEIKIKMNVCNVCVNNRHDHANASLFPSDSLFSHRPLRLIWTAALAQFQKLYGKLF